MVASSDNTGTASEKVSDVSPSNYVLTVKVFKDGSSVQFSRQSYQVTNSSNGNVALYLGNSYLFSLKV